MKIAVIGTGIAGNVAAYKLRQNHEITVFEAGTYIGGHTNTVDVYENDFSFVEKVKAITLENFEAYFKEAGITLKNCFGDYHLQPYSKNTSERLILIFA